MFLAVHCSHNWQGQLAPKVQLVLPGHKQSLDQSVFQARLSSVWGLLSRQGLLFTRFLLSSTIPFTSHPEVFVDKLLFL
jgi:hypothetical protein